MHSLEAEGLARDDSWLAGEGQEQTGVRSLQRQGCLTQEAPGSCCWIQAVEAEGRRGLATEPDGPDPELIPGAEGGLVDGLPHPALLIP